MDDYWEGEIYGQQAVKRVLSHLLESSKISHAFLFTGIEGCGKVFTAIRFIEALNAKTAASNTSNSILNNIKNFSEPYVKYIFPLPRGKNETDTSGPIEKLSADELQLLRDELEKKINNPYHKIVIPKASQIKISSIRDIKRFLSFDYSDLSYRVILISDAHLMNEEAQNALLKNLEEPPSGVIFILTTPYPDLLRETIRSRCWTVNFHPLDNNELKNILINYFDVESKLAETIAPFAGGSVSMALDLIEHDFELLRDKTILILRYSFGRKYHSAINEFVPFLNNNDVSSVKLLIQMIIVWLNDVQKFRINSGQYYFQEGYLDTLEKFNKRFPNLKFNNTVYNLDRLSSIIKNNVGLNLIALNIIFELSSLTMKGLSK